MRIGRDLYDVALRYKRVLWFTELQRDIYLWIVIVGEQICTTEHACFVVAATSDWIGTVSPTGQAGFI